MSNDVVRFSLQSMMLLLTFTGAGLYLRGFWVYLKTVAWLHRSEQSQLKRRYRSSALAAVFREPDLMEARQQLLLAAMGLPLFVLGGVGFNLLQRALAY